MKSKKPFSVQEFLEVKMNKKIKEFPESLEGLDCVFQFEIDSGTWNLDLTSQDPTILTGKHRSADCTVVISTENFEKLIRGQLNVPLALLTGKFKIKGDKSLALKLAKLFS